MNFRPKDSNDNNPTLVELMAERTTGDRPLHEPKMAKFTDLYIRHMATMNKPRGAGVFSK